MSITVRVLERGTELSHGGTKWDLLSLPVPPGLRVLELLVLETLMSTQSSLKGAFEIQFLSLIPLLHVLEPKNAVEVENEIGLVK